MSYIRKHFIKKISGFAGDIYENKFLVYLILLVALSSFIGLVINLILKFHLLAYITGTGLLFFIAFYFYLRFSKAFSTAKWVINVLLFVYLDVLWYFNFGSKGPILYIYILVFSLIIFIWEGRLRILLSVVFFINTLLMMSFEINNSVNMGEYPDETTRILDVYSGIFFYLALVTWLLLSVKKTLVRERLRAEKSEKLKTAFLENVSHEIRTPMNAIVGFSSLLKKPGLSKEKSESYIDIINANSNYLISLINDIIDLSRLEANDLQIEYREVDIQNLFESLKSMMDSYARNIGHAAIEIKYDISPSIDVIITDYVRIKQIMLNLLTNAVKYSEKGVVMFKCEYIQNYYMFSVSDEGVGIIDDFKEHIFERFYKFSHFEKKEHAGTGLGLAITYNLIERLGGEIWFDSTPGQGTNFYFTLPVLKNVRLGKL